MAVNVNELDLFTRDSKEKSLLALKELLKDCINQKDIDHIGCDLRS